jgi:hypothetical protein
MSASGGNAFFQRKRHPGFSSQPNAQHSIDSGKSCSPILKSIKTRFLPALNPCACDCRRCSSHCKGPNPFFPDHAEYRKCIGNRFYFSKLDRADQDSLLD